MVLIKKLSLLTFIFCFLVSITPTRAFADETTPPARFKWGRLGCGVIILVGVIGLGSYLLFSAKNEVQEEGMENRPKEVQKEERRPFIDNHGLGRKRPGEL